MFPSLLCGTKLGLTMADDSVSREKSLGVTPRKGRYCSSDGNWLYSLTRRRCRKVLKLVVSLKEEPDESGG